VIWVGKNLAEQATDSVGNPSPAVAAILCVAFCFLSEAAVASFS